MKASGIGVTRSIDFLRADVGGPSQNAMLEMRCGDSVRQSLLFGETIEDFKWLFQTWVDAMGGVHPKTINTDQDAAIAGGGVSGYTGDADDNFHIPSNVLANVGVHMHELSSGTLATQSSQACDLLDPYIVVTKGRVAKRMKGPIELSRSGAKMCRGCNKLVVGHDKCNYPYLKSVDPTNQSYNIDVISTARGMGRGHGRRGLNTTVWLDEGSQLKGYGQVHIDFESEVIPCKNQEIGAQSNLNTDKHGEIVGDLGDLLQCMSMMNHEIHHLKKEVCFLKEADKCCELDVSAIKRNQVLMVVVICAILAGLLALGQQHFGTEKLHWCGRNLEQRANDFTNPTASKRDELLKRRKKHTLGPDG
ncbi:hypothetical protein ACLOJK_028958 [Asimina triloba]